jgi:hypothetical protein
MKEITMAERGDAYMPTVKPAHKNPTKVSRTLPWSARRVTAITNPKKPTFNMPTNFAVFT